MFPTADALFNQPVGHTKEFESAPKSLTRPHQKIDSDINELEHMILPPGAESYELSPISVLPPETLSNIFILVRDFSNKSRGRDHHARWIYVGQVCHHWREVALGCPSLWSIPVFTKKPELAQEMMRRSKLAPLTIRASLSSATFKSETLEQLKNALAQTPRIQSIDIALQNAEEFNAIFSSLPQQTPLLENLSLHAPFHDELDSFPLDTLSYSPRLRSIDLYTGILSWDSAIFKDKNLTALCLRDDSIGASTMGQMMDVLYHSPNLRILKLDKSIPSHATVNGKEKTVEFKFLEELELDAESKSCVFLLRHIQYPSHVMVRLYPKSTSVTDSAALLSLLSQKFYRTQSTQSNTPHSAVVIQSARMSFQNPGFIEIDFFTVDSKKVLAIQDGNYNPFVRIGLFDSWNSTQACAHLVASVRNFNLSSIKSLLLDWTFTNIHISTIQDCFGNLPKLEIIQVSRSFLKICLAIAPIDKSQHSSSPFFPALKTLVIQGVNFRPRRNPKTGRDLEIVDYLTEMLNYRRVMKMPIESLSMEECRGVRTWHMDLLADRVTRLEVDGEVIDAEWFHHNRWTDDSENQSDY